MCDLEAIDTPSMLRLIHSTGVLVRMLPSLDVTGSRTPHGENETLRGLFAQAELLKQQMFDMSYMGTKV